MPDNIADFYVGWNQTLSVVFRELCGGYELSEISPLNSDYSQRYSDIQIWRMMNIFGTESCKKPMISRLNFTSGLTRSERPTLPVQGKCIIVS